MGQHCSAFEVAGPASARPPEDRPVLCRHAEDSPGGEQTAEEAAEEEEELGQEVIAPARARAAAAGAGGAERQLQEPEAPTGEPACRHVKELAMPMGGAFCGQVRELDGKPHGVGKQRWPDGAECSL
ncbi:unnamed protein product [Prorocentrum cordatum]|uniref:Uncharacterized protein n=1 Tax=Prorocentrum cordatum TaxID=2364126 RepID=A0ABN9V275_9DINO|nr:unnamed protein product [Polarella glacialis]